MPSKQPSPASKKAARPAPAAKTRRPSAAKSGNGPVQSAAGKKLVIVESPAKAKTIEKFLGADYKVVASYGHIRDLPGSATEIPEEIRSKPWARLAVDTDNDFQPVYVIPKDSRKHVTELKRILKGAAELLLATDEDREGESISWHLQQVLEPKVPVLRISFNEITRTAIQDALANPRQVDEQLVRAQESRRILDRLYGYSLSPVLWKKVRSNLSAGRVQSSALRLIVEREEERLAFHRAEYWDVEARLRGGELPFSARLIAIGDDKLAAGKDFDADTGKLKKDADARILNGEEAQRIARDAITALPWVVERVERKQTKQRPGPPFITSTIQQAASSRLGMSPRQTMMVAQRLYEGVDLGGGEREGLITYMRTDSVTLSEKALNDFAGHIKSTFGEEYYGGPRRFKTKSKSAQEAHEAIRPTDVRWTPDRVAAHLEPEELKLYRLIWNRTVASQMAEAELDKTAVDLVVTLDGRPHRFRANGSVVRFAGYLKVYEGEQKETILPEMSEGQRIGSGDGERAIVIEGAEAQRHETTPPPRYTEASLIKKLEEEGIGRPSTYAPTLSTIQARDYVIKRNGALVPAYVGMAVTNLLRQHFPHYVDLKFTAKMEDDLDHIASGEVNWIDFLSGFYRGENGNAIGLLRRIDEELPKIEFPVIDIGNDPVTGEPIRVRIGRNSAFLQRGSGRDATATLPTDLLIDELTVEKARELIEARSKGNEPLGQDPETEKNIYVLIGPYGPYVQLGESDEKPKPKRASLPRGTDLGGVTLEQALRLLSLPRLIGAHPETGKPVRAGHGRFGPYVESDGVYGKLDDHDQAFTVTLEDALARIAAKKTGGKQLIKELGDHPESGKKIQVMRGRYGPYVTDGKVNGTLGKDADPQAVTMEEAVKLLAEAATKKKTPRRRK